MKKKYSNIKASIKDIYKCFLFFLKMQWKFDKTGFFVVALPQLLGAVNSLVIVIFPGHLLDSLAKKDYNLFTRIVLAFVVWELSVAIIQAVVYRLSSIRNEKFSSKLHHILVKKITTLRQEQLEKTEVLKSYDLALKCMKENSITSYIGNIFSLISTFVVLSGLVYVLKILPVWLLIPFILGTAVHAVTSSIISKRAVEEAEEELPIERQKRYLGYELIKPLYGKEIRLFNLEPFILSKYDKSINDYYHIKKRYNKNKIKILKYANISEGVLSIIFYSCNICRFAMGLLTVGLFTISTSAMFHFSKSFKSIVSIVINSARQSTMLNKVRDFLNISGTQVGTDKVPEFQSNGSIEFVNVSYRYPGSDKYALENINIRINFGDKISVVGPNGAGKTTFIALMVGLYKPTSGTILYNGIDIENFEYSSYKNIFSVLLQDYNIYSFTVLENILLSENPSESDITSAMKSIEQIGLDNVIDKMPDKEHTYLTQRFNKEGVDLSGGEKQKLALARVLNRNAPFIILDEPTASLSPQNEYDIYKRFAEITKNKTVVFISHRLSSCRLCDRIIVFNDGQITENGTHESLLGNNSLYAEMYSKQAELYM